MASNRKKRIRRNRLIITIATILIVFCVIMMVFVALEATRSNSSEGSPFLIMEVPLLIAILIIFFVAKDRIK